MELETFHRDLAGGKIVEAKHLKVIRKTYPDAYMIDGYCKEWDIYIPSGSFGIEVKSDKMSQKTGNIVVEVRFNGKASALSTTKSRYWIFDTGVKSMMVEVTRLRKLVEESQDRKRTFTALGDTHPKDAYLIEQKHIEELDCNFPSGALDTFL
jgi:hypothetical protein